MQNLMDLNQIKQFSLSWSRKPKSSLYERKPKSSLYEFEKKTVFTPSLE